MAKVKLSDIVDGMDMIGDETRAFLARHPRIHLHSTPTHASWLNIVENELSSLTRQSPCPSAPRIPSRLH